VGPQILEIDKLEDRRMRRFEIDRCRPATIERCFPTRHADAPAVARFQSWETPLGHRSDEIVAVEHREIEKFLGDFDADGMQTDVFRSGAAIPIAIKSSHRIATTAAQFGTKNVGWHGDMLPKERRFPNRRLFIGATPLKDVRRFVNRRSLFHQFRAMETGNPGEQIITYWLCPAEPARRQLAAMIRDLAARFAAPVFEPHVTLYVTSTDREDPNKVLAEVRSRQREYRLPIRGLDYSDKFTKTLFVEFAPDTGLARLSEDLRRASASPNDYELNPHLSLLYKDMDQETKRGLAVSIALPFTEMIFDSVKAVISPATISSREDVEAWRVVAERRLTE
jgi:2'-5' RNA ligase